MSKYYFNLLISISMVITGGCVNNNAKTSSRLSKRQSVTLPSVPAVPVGRVTISVNDSLGTISQDLLGTNVIYSKEKDSMWKDGRVAKLLKQLDVGFLRYPGGEVTSYYHWQQPNGLSFNDQWDPNRVQIPPVSHDQWMSFAEYLTVAKASGAKPLVGINIQSGHSFNPIIDGEKVNGVEASLEEAKALVREGKKHGVTHYFLDNEQYEHICSNTTPRICSDERKMSSSVYANYINLYATTLRKIDPNLKLVINWQNTVSDGLRTIIKQAGDHIDYVDFHLYWNRDAASFKNWMGKELMKHTDGNGNSETYVEKIQSFRKAVNNPNIKLAALEWNLGPVKASERPSQFQAALMNSEMLMQFMLGGLDAAAFWPLHYEYPADGGEPKRSLLSPGSLDETPIYRMLSMYRSLLGSNLIKSQSAVPGVFVLAARRSEATTVLLLEKTGEARTISLNAEGLFNSESDDVFTVQRFQGMGGDSSQNIAEILSIPVQYDKAQKTVTFEVGAHTLTKLDIYHNGRKLTCFYAVGDGSGVVKYYEESRYTTASEYSGYKNEFNDLCRYTESALRQIYPAWKFFTEIKTGIGSSSNKAITCQYNAVRNGTLMGTMEATVAFSDGDQSAFTARDLAQSRCRVKYASSSCNFIRCQ